MYFIRVTGLGGAKRIVNAADIVTAVETPDGTKINVRYGDLHWFMVSESPDQIFNLIREANRK